MDILANLLSKIHTGIKLFAFLLVLITTGATLKALSPIDYESYTRMTQNLKQSQLARDNAEKTGSVAGENTQSGVTLVVENLLEEKNFGYKFNSTGKAAQLQITITNQNFTDLNLFKYTNKNSHVQRYLVQASSSDGKVKLFSRSEVGIYEFTDSFVMALDPNESAYVGIHSSSNLHIKSLSLSIGEVTGRMDKLP